MPSDSSKVLLPSMRDAPKFEGDKPSELNRFLDEWKTSLKEEALLMTVKKSLWWANMLMPEPKKQWQFFNKYDAGTWVEFKKELQESYIEALDDELGSITKLKKICRKHSPIASDELKDLQAFKREFVAEARSLFKEPAVLSNHEAIDLFLDCLSKEFQE
ncbi:hypothetical protein CPB84DRAFT_1754971 [Gymnopilus junonius]|uniref:Uncharacterized protein n=1 Tax=Gymnopilus junonius TaxID=109634 RepID=A0A9P5N9B5_GYMJU|nr:hypothetical protein CPB84DRAFT_1754971 [Gymnopilus junonius]